MADHQLRDFAYKLEAAVDTLATSPRNLQDRLYYAAMTWIGYHRDNLPDGQYRDTFEAIWRELTATPATGEEGTLRATCSALTDDKAQRIAQTICDLTRAVRAAGGS